MPAGWLVRDCAESTRWYVPPIETNTLCIVKINKYFRLARAVKYSVETIIGFRAIPEVVPQLKSHVNRSVVENVIDLYRSTTWLCATGGYYAADRIRKNGVFRIYHRSASTILVLNMTYIRCVCRRYQCEALLRNNFRVILLSKTMKRCT